MKNLSMLFLLFINFSTTHVMAMQGESSESVSGFPTERDPEGSVVLARLQQQIISLHEKVENIQSGNRSAINPPSIETILKAETFENMSDEDASDCIMAQGDAAIQCMVNRLTKKDDRGRSNDVGRSLVLYGPAGQGKSYLARAIGKRCGYATYYIPSTANLENEFQASGRKNFERLFEQFKNTTTPKLLILEELTLILAPKNSSGHNPNTNSSDLATASSFWTHLEECMSNKNFMFIGTTNFLDNLPTPVTDRFAVSLHEINKSVPVLRIRIIKHYQQEGGLSDTDISIIRKKTDHLSLRQLKNTLDRAEDFAYGSPDADENTVLKREHVFKALGYTNHNRRVLGIDHNWFKTRWINWGCQRYLQPYLPSVVSFCAHAALQVCLGYFNHNLQGVLHEQSLRLQDAHFDRMRNHTINREFLSLVRHLPQEIAALSDVAGEYRDYYHYVSRGRWFDGGQYELRPALKALKEQAETEALAYMTQAPESEQ